MEIKYNPVRLNTIQDFVSIHSRRNTKQRQVYFALAEGNGPKLLTDISAADRIGDTDEHTAYCRLVQLSTLSDTEKVSGYLSKYNNFKSGDDLLYPQYPELSAEIAEAMRDLFSQLREVNPEMTETAERNTAVQLLYRTEHHLFGLLEQRKNKFCKLIYSGCSKTSEFLFGCLAALLGIDTLILIPEGNGRIPEKMMKNCIRMNYGEHSRVVFPEYKPAVNAEPKTAPPKQPEIKTEPTIKLHIPPRSDRKPIAESVRVQTNTASKTAPKEKNYEELAALAESVVMILILDETGKPIAGGSGIAIRRDGYILTNYHVIQGGCGFCVRIENDDEVYDTVELIKYHPQFDLALIRIHREMPPLPLYDDRRQLRRGEKVFTIGSPMGLFNSVSDGIISGFRQIKDRDMIQFTAPISHGSSGGALLNSYGEVIGICTSGIDEGQNLNLAVSYKLIRSFAANIL